MNVLGGARWLKLRGPHRRADWRRVPQINLLAPVRRWPAPAVVARAFLVVLLLAGGYWLQNIYSTKAAADQATQQATVELSGAQKELSTEQADIQKLRSQIEQLTSQQGQQGSVPGRVEWEATLSTLFQAEGSGITFQSVEGKAGGELTLEAAVVDVAALGEFEAAIQKLTDRIDVHSLVWNQEEKVLTLTATIREQL